MSERRLRSCFPPRAPEGPDIERGRPHVSAGLSGRTQGYATRSRTISVITKISTAVRSSLVMFSTGSSLG